MKNRKIFNGSDKELRGLILELQRAGEHELANMLLEDVVSAENAHKKYAEDLTETEDLNDYNEKEEDFEPESVNQEDMESLNRMLRLYEMFENKSK